MHDELYIKLNLQLFADPNTQTTESPGLTAGMHTYYEDRLIDYAGPKLVHDQFGDKYPIPKNSGRTIQFRGYNPLPKALATLTEGVTPDGGNLEMFTKEAVVDQYGHYVTISDRLQTEHTDPQIEQALKMLGSQAGRTLDTVTRDVINAGTNVSYAPKIVSGAETEVLSRADLDVTAQLTRTAIFKGAAKLNEMNAVPIDDAFVAIIHPNVACDLMLSDGWLDVHKYAAPDNIYKGEIGMLGGVRFVRTTEAKIVAPAEISDKIRRLHVKTAIATASTSVAIKEVLTSATPAEPIPVYINGVANTIVAIATTGTGASAATTITLGTAITAAVDDMICGQGAAKNGESVYCTMVLASGAYGVTEITGGGLQHIVKQLGSAGSADPLNQRATVGWKATKVAERLVEDYMLRIEHCSATGTYATNE